MPSPIEDFSMEPEPDQPRYCPRCGAMQFKQRREDRTPQVQWECRRGHAFPVYTRQDEA